MSDKGQEDNNITSTQTAPIIGGHLICETHKIKTLDLNEWNEHNRKYHDIRVEAKCEGCGVEMIIAHMPYQNVSARGRDIHLKCKTCYEKQLDLNKLIHEGGNSS